MVEAWEDEHDQDKAAVQTLTDAWKEEVRESQPRPSSTHQLSRVSRWLFVFFFGFSRMISIKHSDNLCMTLIDYLDLT